MKSIKKIGYLLIAIFIMTMMISCVRPASTENNEDLDTESQVDSIIRSAATQTAIASEGIGGGASLDDEMSVGAGTPTVVYVATVAPTEVPATATPVPTPVEVVPTTYTIQEGEFPFCIARRFDVDTDTLLSVNGVSSGQVFYPGFNLIIPQNAESFSGNRQLRVHPVASYTVQSGETFSSIACLFGDLYPESIAAANQLSVTDVLVAGSTISIP